MAHVTLERVSKVFPGRILALEPTDLRVRDGELLVLLGPSGCGKSTMLRIIAGLEEPSSGRVLIGERDVTRVHPRDRNVAMVFQSYALYPHMTVFDNLAFGLRMRKTPPDETRSKVMRAAEILEIEDLLDRKPGALSGGQRQRVALGRAIVRDPEVFLLDEPLSNLDAVLRAQMRAELVALHRKVGGTTIYVTHDQIEAMTMGDRIAVMREGKLLQVGSPSEVYARPASTFVASFIGTPPMNLWSAVAEGGTVRIPGGGPALSISPEFEEALGARAGRPVLAGARPEDLEIRSEPEGRECVRGLVELVEYTGSETYLRVSSPLGNLVARAGDAKGASRGQHVFVRVPPESLHLFDPESGLRLG